MSFAVNNKNINTIYFNGEKVNSVYYNKNFVWGIEEWKGLNQATWDELYNLCQDKRKGLIDWPADITLGAVKTLNYASKYNKSTKGDFIIIGIDVDGPGTITFHSKNTVGYPITHPTGISYADGGYAFNGVEACDWFYEVCGIKDCIKTVYKGTCIENGNFQRNVPATYAEAKIWIPSEFEMGLNWYSPLNMDLTNATNAEATYGVNEPYPWYNNQSITEQQREIRRNKGFDTESLPNVNGLNHYWTRSLAYQAGKGCLIADTYTNNDEEDVLLKSVDEEYGFAPAFVIG